MGSNEMIEVQVHWVPVGINSIKSDKTEQVKWGKGLTPNRGFQTKILKQAGACQGNLCLMHQPTYFK